jgi:hypothetical protein
MTMLLVHMAIPEARLSVAKSAAGLSGVKMENRLIQAVESKVTCKRGGTQNDRPDAA